MPRTTDDPGDPRRRDPWRRSTSDTSRRSTAVSRSGTVGTPCWRSRRDAGRGGWPSSARPASVMASGPPARPRRGACSLRPAGGPWLIVGVSPQGRDDRGRPGALAFHALFVTPRDYARAGASPFGFAHLLRGDWTAGTRSLPSGTAVIELPRPPDDLPDEQVGAAGAGPVQGSPSHARGRRPALARQVWAALPSGTRRQLGRDVGLW